MQFIYIQFIIFLLGLIFGSFASVIIFRLKKKIKGGILSGRSRCLKCKHKLGFFDLFPVFSYIFLKGKCRYCYKKINYIYPLLEFSMGLVFLMVSFYLIDINLIILGNIFEIIKLIFFLFISFIIVVFIFYDIIFMEVPDEIMKPGILFLLLLLIFSSVIHNFNIFNYFKIFDNFYLSIPFINAVLASFIIYTFFYLQIFISGLIYVFKVKNYKIIKELIILYFIFPFYTPKQDNEEETEEIPFWMGFGDLRLAIFIGFVGGIKISLLGLILAYFIGSIVGIFILIKNKSKNIKVPFGPFLGVGLLLALMFYDKIINIYLNIL